MRPGLDPEVGKITRRRPSSILAWRISWTEKPGGLQSMGSQRVGRHWVARLTLSLLNKNFTKMIDYNRPYWCYLNFTLPICTGRDSKTVFLKLLKFLYMFNMVYHVLIPPENRKSYGNCCAYDCTLKGR